MKLSLVLGVAALSALSFGPVFAAEWPERPVTLIVGYVPGGPSDVGARYLANKLEERLGQSVIVENVPGAGGAVSLERMLRAEPDGYTLYFQALGPMNTVLLPQLSANAVDQMAAVAPVWTISNAWFASAAQPFQTMPEMLDWAQANPGELNIGQSIPSAAIVISMLLHSSGTEAEIIPYKGGGEVFQGLISGEVQAVYDSIGQYVGSIKEGLVRPLMFAGKTRHPSLPDVPTAIEAGFPELSDSVTLGIWAPKGVSNVIVEEVNAAVNEVLALPETVAYFGNLGAQVLPGSAQDLQAVAGAEVTFWEKAAATIGYKPQ